MGTGDVDGDDYGGMFAAHLGRALAATLDEWARAGPPWADDLCSRTLHLLAYALAAPAQWPATRALLLAAATPLQLKGYRREWMAQLAQALALAGAQQDRAGAVQLHLHLGRLHLRLGEHAAAEAQLAAALALATALGDPAATAAAHVRLADLGVARSDFPAALAHAAASLALLDPGDPAGAAAHSVLGFVAFRQADWPTATRHATACLALRRAEGEPRFVAQSLVFLGQVEAEAGRPAVAVALLSEAVAQFGLTADPLGAAVTQISLGLAHSYGGDHAAALACYAAAEPVLLRVASQPWLSRLCNNRGYACEQQGDLAGAVAAYTAAVAHARAANDPLETANALDSLAGGYLRQGEVAAARAVLHAAQAELERLPVQPGHLRQLIAEKLGEIGTGGRG